MAKEEFRLSTMKWAREPFDRFLGYIQEIDRILHLSIRGIGALRGAYRLTEALQAVDPPMEGTEDANDQLRQLEEAKSITELAEQEVRAVFPLLHAHAVVALWGALEALVDDFLICWLLHEPSALEADALQRIRIPLAQYERLHRDDRMRMLVEELQRELRAEHSPGVAGFEKCLACFGLSGKVHEDVKRTLIEMRQVRNIMVHNRGVIDRRFMNVCPWTNYQLDDRVNIDHETYQRFFRAVHEYVLALINRVRVFAGIEPYEVGGGPLENEPKETGELTKVDAVFGTADTNAT